MSTYTHMYIDYMNIYTHMCIDYMNSLGYKFKIIWK